MRVEALSNSDRRKPPLQTTRKGVKWRVVDLACILAFAGTIPVAAWQAWLFVKPALKSYERKVALAYIPALFILFICGLAFGYYCVFPNILGFLTNLGKGMMMVNFTAEKYFSFWNISYSTNRRDYQKDDRAYFMFGHKMEYYFIQN